jgi:hypothetical protein
VLRAVHAQGDEKAIPVDYKNLGKVVSTGSVIKVR